GGAELAGAGLGVPDPDQAVPAARGGKSAVVGEGGGVLPLGRPGEGAEEAAGGAVPELDAAVGTRRDQSLAVTAEGQLVDRARVAADLAGRLLVVESPPAELRLVACGDELRPTGIDRHGEDVVVVVAVGASLLEGRDVDPLRRAVLAHA